MNKLINKFKKYMNKKNMSPLPIIEVENEITKGMSSTPPKAKEMDFPDALREVIAGKKITKLEWKENGISDFVIMEKLSDNKEYLLLYKNEKPHKFILTDGDLKGEDFVVVN